MDIPNLAGLSLAQIFTYLVILTTVDVVFNTGLSLKRGEFSVQYVLDYVRTHVMLRIFAIGGLAIIGNGVPVLNVPEIPAVTLFATGSLGLYLVETVASLRGALTDTSPQ